MLFRSVWYTRLQAWYARIERWVVGGSRKRVIAILSALVLLAIALSVTAVATWPRSPAPAVASAPRPTSTASATATGTATLTPRPNTPTPRPHTVATSVPTTPPAPVQPKPPASTPTVTFCPTATATEPPTATATATTAPVAAVTAPAPAGGRALADLQPRATCTPCPYYTGNNPSQPSIGAALDAAADAYHLPRNLVRAVAWQESHWHEDAYSCDGGIGLMQVQYYTWQWINQLNMPNCHLSATTYVPTTLDGNAGLGAKYLAYLSCFYSYDGGSGGTLQQPGTYTMAWYYQQAGLRYPDATNPDGSANASSLCVAVFSDPNHPEYPDMPTTTASTWSCPYSATEGDTTLLDITLSAYNEGPGYTDQCGICNPWYVASVEGYVPQFYAGTLPTPS